MALANLGAQEPEVGRVPQLWGQFALLSKFQVIVGCEYEIMSQNKQKS